MRMKHQAIARRRATNVTLPEDVAAEARALNVNISKVAESALRVPLRQERTRRWQEDHQERVDAFTVWFEENGLPFQDIRVF